MPATRVTVSTHPDHYEEIDRAALDRQGTRGQAELPGQVVYYFASEDLAYGFEKFICKASGDTTTVRQTTGSTDGPAPLVRVIIAEWNAAGPLSTADMLDNLSNDFYGWQDPEQPMAFLFPNDVQADGFVECVQELDPLAGGFTREEVRHV